MTKGRKSIKINDYELQPREGIVIVRAVEIGEVTQGGIIIQTDAQNKGNIVEVVKASEEEESDVVEGDLYYCSQEFSDPVELTGEKLYFVDPSYLLAKLVKNRSKK